MRHKNRVTSSKLEQWADSWRLLQWALTSNLLGRFEATASLTPEEIQIIEVATP